MAPALTALPDLTFPSRKDSRYGVSLAHPAYLECWEAGYAWLDDARPAELAAWLDDLRRAPTKEELLYDAWLSDAGETAGSANGRADLSWWALLTMAPELPSSSATWRAPGRLLASQGLAVLRHEDRYVSVECLGGGHGHGHPDRLHLTLHANGVHWLPDPGTGSYVTPDLFWYRSTLAHNAPRLDGNDQPLTDPARCLAYEQQGDWGWTLASWNHVRRTTILGPGWLLDVAECADENAHTLELPWHFAGDISIETAGTWAPAELSNDFVTEVEQFTPAGSDPVIARATGDGVSLRAFFVGDAETIRATGPGLPGSGRPAQFLVRRAHGKVARLVTVLDLKGEVSSVAAVGDTVTITGKEGASTVQLFPGEVHVATGKRHFVLAGTRPEARLLEPLFADKPLVGRGRALWIEPPPVLDGSVAGFNLSAPLRLEGEHHYLRSEEPYSGAASFAARVAVNWDDQALYVAVDVTKADLVVRPVDAPPLLLDNEPDDIHSDGVQVYYRMDDAPVIGYLIRPGDNGTLIVRAIGDEAASLAQPSGGWQRTKKGYRLTFALPCQELDSFRLQGRFTFDVVVNEMQRDRVRRAGQLAWSGGHGWVYLRGDRFDPEQFGVLEFFG